MRSSPFYSGTWRQRMPRGRGTTVGKGTPRFISAAGLKQPVHLPCRTSIPRLRQSTVSRDFPQGRLRLLPRLESDPIKWVHCRHIHFIVNGGDQSRPSKRFEQRRSVKTAFHMFLHSVYEEAPQIESSVLVPTAFWQVADMVAQHAGGDVARIG